MIPAASLSMVLVCSLWASACANAPIESDTAPSPASASTSTSSDHDAHAASGPVTPPPLDAAAPANLPGLHNVVAYDDGVYSGGVPEGDAGFATLAALGIATVVSVDGARPEVEAATRHGLRYVHLPIGYDGITPERSREIAQALANVAGPVYVHCHHGKHRSAGATAVGCVGTGRLSPEQAMARMKISGTADTYQGLWAAAREMKPLDAGALRRDPSTFESVAKVSGMVEAMSAIDQAFENLKAADPTTWAAPADHPDLVPANESDRVAALFAALKQDPESMAHPADYQTMLDRAIEQSKAFDAALRGGDAATAAARFKALGATCKECHRGYRDN